MNKKTVGIVFAVMLGMILIESYFLLVQPDQSASDKNAPSSTSQTPSSSSANETADSVSFVPAVPEFIVELVDRSYDVPTTYSTDPYTGKQVSHEGYHVVRRTIDVRIKYQPFTPYIGSGGLEIKFYYNIRIKGHYVEWGKFDVVYDLDEMPTQSNSEYTVISYNSESVYTFVLGTTSRALEVSPGGELDFQVKALVGYTHEVYNPAGPNSLAFVGETSDWSPTQTITIP